MPEWKEEITKRLGPLNLDGEREAAIVDEFASHAADYYEELLRQGQTEEALRARVQAELADGKISANLHPLWYTRRSHGPTTVCSYAAVLHLPLRCG
jgi:hypothetical protein